MSSLFERFRGTESPVQATGQVTTLKCFRTWGGEGTAAYSTCSGHHRIYLPRRTHLSVFCSTSLDEANIMNLSLNYTIMLFTKERLVESKEIMY